MKLTPEQKAHYEYGRSRGWLKAHRSKRYFVDVVDMGLHAWHIERDMHGLDALIRDAWWKRAACRAWVHPMRRRCSNCKHELTQYKFCAACVHEGWPVYWEPRKEGES